MRLGNSIQRTIILSLPLAIAACGSSGSEAPAPTGLTSATQNQTVDPDGMTTDFSFSFAPTGAVAANFEANGGQTAQSVTIAGNVATVVWDMRVTPSDQVRVVSFGGVPDTWTSVATSDATAPDFTISPATMVAGHGGDSFTVTFTGPRVVETAAEDPSNWTLTVGGQTLDMTGSVLDLNPASQIMTVVLGSNANLHSTFTFAAATLTSVADVAVPTTAKNGTASGDAAAPSLVSANQNLTADEFGRVVDYTFDEAMDPVFCTSLANFSIALPDIATDVTLTSETVVQVTFSRPMIPGTDTVTLANLVDAHGNAYVGGVTAIAQPSPVANGYTTEDAVTVSNLGGDYIDVNFTQALVEDECEDPTNWTLVVDGSPVTMTNQTLTYDLLTKHLRIDLDFDMKNGDAWTLTPGGITEVDGESFVTAATGNAGGDVTAPLAFLALQNRTMDATGVTVDVNLSEDLETAPAQNSANWSITGGLSVISATLLPNLNSVRLVCDGPVVPGDYTIGCDNLEDLAGAVMASAQTGVTVFTTDNTDPNATSTAANAIAGPDNDTLFVYFDDDMISSEVTDLTNWSFESPIGTVRDMTGTTLTYNSSLRQAAFVFDAAGDIDLHGMDSFRVGVDTMRDIAGNTVNTIELDGTVVGETDRPYADYAWYDTTDADVVVVYFNEHCERLDDLYDPTTNRAGSRFELYDSGSSFRGRPVSATVLDDGLGVRLSFGFIVSPTDTIHVMGISDLAGNYLFPLSGNLGLAMEDASEAAHDAVATPVVAVSGERNDTLEVRFDLPMSPWGIEDPANYSISDGVHTPDLSNATFAFDGDRTVMISLDSLSADSFHFGRSYDIVVDGLTTAQGVELSGPITEVGVATSGDNTVPTVGVSDVRVDPSVANSLIVTVDEALDVTIAETAANYDYNSGSIATSATLIEPRTVRVTFGVQPAAGFDLDFTVTDLAQNATGTLTRTVAVSEGNTPLLVSVAGESVAGDGGDTVTVVYNEPVDPGTATELTNYSVTNGTAKSLAGASAEYDSAAMTVTIYLANGVELDAALSINVGVANVSDLSGNAMSSTPVGLSGTVTGDLVAPGVLASFVNFREDTNGYDVEVLFTEDVDATFASDIFNWTCSGGQTVIDVQMISSDHARVLLLAPIVDGDNIEIAAGLPDSAGNTAGAISAPISF
jgi:hypothetical protein